MPFDLCLFTFFPLSLYLLQHKQHQPNQNRPPHHAPTPTCLHGGHCPRAPRRPKAARRPARAGYQVPYAEALRRETGIPTLAVGLILTPGQAERILERGQADLVLLAREALFDPHWTLHAARELEPDAGGWDFWPPSWGWWLAQRDRIGIEADD